MPKKKNEPSKAKRMAARVVRAGTNPYPRGKKAKTVSRATHGTYFSADKSKAWREVEKAFRDAGASKSVIRRVQSQMVDTKTKVSAKTGDFKRTKYTKPGDLNLSDKAARATKVIRKKKTSGKKKR